MKYCSSTPANDAFPGPSHPECLSPTPTRSSFPPAWQIARAGAFAWPEKKPPPDPASPCAVERTESCPLRAASERISTERSRRYSRGSSVKVLRTVNAPAVARNTAEWASWRTSSYPASAATTSAPAASRSAVESGSGWPGCTCTRSTCVSFALPVWRRWNFSPFNSTDFNAAPSEVSTTCSLSESRATDLSGGRGCDVPRGTPVAGAAPAAELPPAEEAAPVGAPEGPLGEDDGCGEEGGVCALRSDCWRAAPASGAPARCGDFGWKTKLQTRATAMHRTTVRRRR